jgi:hypothetical protein
VKVTTNWVGLTMRYIVDPKKRRVAQTYMYTNLFDRIFQRNDIQIGSDTMNVTLQQANAQLQTEEPREDGDRAA